MQRRDVDVIEPVHHRSFRSAPSRQTSAGVARNAPAGRFPEAPPGKTPAPQRHGRFALGALVSVAALLATAAGGCGNAAQQGDCGPYLSSGECAVVRAQLGTLAAHPPADPTNKYGQCEKDGTRECAMEEAAAQLGRRLFYDACLSRDSKTSCATCHESTKGFIDARERPLLRNGLPLIENASMERVKMGPEQQVRAQVDLNGVPLARWDGTQWQPVRRRPQASWSALVMGRPQGATARHSPSLYNMGYGATVAPGDLASTYGIVWAPWDGRYDSAWALVADVYEFGGTQNTDRAHIAARIYQKHRAQYEAMTGRQLKNMDETDGQGRYVYLRHGAPGAAATDPSACWYDPAMCAPNSAPPTEAVRNEVNQIFVDAGKSLGSFMRRLRSGNSAYDRWRDGETEAMSPAAQRGLRLFIGKAECIMCHSGANFTDWRFHNLGVPSADPEVRVAGSNQAATETLRDLCFDGFGPSSICPDPGRQGWQPRASGLCMNDSDSKGDLSVSCQPVDRIAKNRYDVPMDCRSAASDAKDKSTQCPSDPGLLCPSLDEKSCQASAQCQWLASPRALTPASSWSPRCVATSTPSELGQFKTPSLRNIALTYPYMHNGAIGDFGPAERGEVAPDDPTPHLTRVIEFYNQGGGYPEIGVLDTQIRPLHLTKLEIADLVEFLKALTDASILNETRELLAIPPADLVDTADCVN